MQMSSAHRACDGDRPARYLKRGAAKLDRRVHEAGCRLCKSERSRVGSSRITNEESDPLRGVGWRVRNQPDANEEARWMANASPATDQERCPIDVDTGHCRPAPPVVERSYARAGRLNGRAVGQARRRSLMRTARPSADEDDDCAQHQRCKSSRGPGESLVQATHFSRARPTEPTTTSLMDLASLMTAPHSPRPSVTPSTLSSAAKTPALRGRGPRRRSQACELPADRGAGAQGRRVEPRSGAS
jgi:hypothetical protein